MGNKSKYVHSHPSALRVGNNLECDLYHQLFRGISSFYWRGCDFNAGSRFYTIDLLNLTNNFII